MAATTVARRASGAPSRPAAWALITSPGSAYARNSGPPPRPSVTSFATEAEALAAKAFRDANPDGAATVLPVDHPALKRLARARAVPG
jgi:hypothetical protein